jgi:uncharacterized membrane protein HdeD (DUF308 family)
MKKYLPVYLYGYIIILEGVFLLFTEFSTFNIEKLTLGCTLSAGAVLAFIAAYESRKKNVQFAYHEIHALTMLVYGISVLLFGNTTEKLTSFTAFLLFFYTFSEIIFCSWIFNLKDLVVFKILVVRVLLALASGVGTIIAMHLPEFTMQIFGLLFILVGINFILYVPIMKETNREDSSQVFS